MSQGAVPHGARHPGWARMLPRFAISAGLLGGLAWLLDADALVRRLIDLDPFWVVVGLAISLPQMALLALRWRLTAGRLGLDLPFGTALREYYLATFLNQLLPGGVMGDVSRAWRHGRAGPGAPPHGSAIASPVPASGLGLGPAARAVVLERASGQLVMAAAAVVALGSLPVAGAVRARVLVIVLGAAAAVVVVAFALERARVASRLASAVWRDVHAALLARDVVGAQLATSVLVLGTYVATYLAAARAVGLTTPFAVLLPLVPPVLLSMLIPVTVAGWGIREAAAAGLWSLVGLTAEDGVAASAAYGLLVLATTLPGAAVLVSAARGRRADPRPDGSAGSAGGAPGPGSPPAEG